MIDTKDFRSKLEAFPSNYMLDFDCFWKWKLVENSRNHILDESHIRQTYDKLKETLANWQTYRGGYNLDPYKSLKESLQRISDAYDKIRKFSLLEFRNVPDQPLKLIWNELGRVKEEQGRRNTSEQYYIISICKPLMLLWGQTLAFDSRVRAHCPHEFGIPKMNRWNFMEWRKVVENIQDYLQEHPKIVNLFKQLSLEKFKADAIVPYGRFLDIYYFV